MGKGAKPWCDLNTIPKIISYCLTTKYCFTVVRYQRARRNILHCALVTSIGNNLP